jgi:hypothetical protein
MRTEIAMDAEPESAVTRTIKVTGAIDRVEAEALVLEVRRLARHHGLDLVQVSVERVADE